MHYLNFLILLLISFFMVGFSQPDWSPFLCILSSCIGLAVFWKGCTFLPKNLSKKFVAATLWFTGIQILQLGWFLSDQYVGWPIYIFLPLLSLFFGLQFGLVTLLILGVPKLSFFRVFTVSFLWVLMEWSRLHILSGFSWNPIGLMLTSNQVSLQFVNLFGVFSLSFWVFFINLIIFKWFEEKRLPILGIACGLALLPYVYGFLSLQIHRKQSQHESKILSAILIQTALLPEEKTFFQKDQKVKVYTPLEQWHRVLNLLQKYRGTVADLIVFSESAFPYGVNAPLYNPYEVKNVFKNTLNVELQLDQNRILSNGDIAYIISQIFNADVILGLEDFSNEKKEAYNAAFFFSPEQSYHKRYKKRVLVPLGEYIPFNWCKRFLSAYGIQDSFTSGKKAKIFKGKNLNYGVSICYEETYGDLMRQNRLLGADVLVNLTNDVWYPNSRLPRVHFLHSRLRAVEEGIPLVRACNTGVTCAIDSLGKTIVELPYENAKQKASPGALFVKFPLYSYPTLYTFIGDPPLIGFSWMWVSLTFIGVCIKRKMAKNSLWYKPIQNSKNVES